MGTAKLDRNNPPRFTDAELARLDAMTEDEVERNAREDVDNPPMTDAELTRLRGAAEVQAVRRARDMTQTVFAETYGIAVARLRDWEQGRFRPDEMARTYLEVIRQAPQVVERARAELRLGQANNPGPRQNIAAVDQIVTALFENREDANKAAVQIRQAGVADSAVIVSPEDAPRTYSDATDRPAKGFWALLENLLGDFEDHGTYIEGVFRGGTLLIIHVNGAKVEDVIRILKQHGSADLDERVPEHAGWLAPV